jgi:hypothetical protein
MVKPLSLQPESFPSTTQHSITKGGRRSWFDAYAEFPPMPGNSLQQNKQNAIAFDQRLFEIWNLGSTVVLAWSVIESAVLLLVCKHTEVIASVLNSTDVSESNERSAYIDSLLAIEHCVSLDEIQEISQHVVAEQLIVPLPFVSGKELGLDLMSAIVKRYSISHVEDRAVLLFDMVGFSLLSPLEQVTQLNSLSCSINAAYAKLLGQGDPLNFARTTTGDGFYIWNRSRGIDANIALYHLLMLILADNAAEHRTSRAKSLTPTLRTCLHVGSHYEFYQPEALNPTTFSYIVGDVTIELARMIEHARPHQILVGAFQSPMYGSDEDSIEITDSVRYIEQIQRHLSSLTGFDIAGGKIDNVRCYLTGGKTANDNYDISEYSVTDKHQQKHSVFNAKLNVHLDGGESIFLGLQESDLGDFPRAIATG